MNKHEQNYQRIEKFKERFRKFSTNAIRHCLGIGSLVKEAAIAYREVLEERGEPLFIENDKNSVTDKDSDAT